MKKYAKSIVTSLLMAVAFGAMTVGTTFALFTSQAKTSIEVEAGKVEVLQTAQIMSVKELGSVDVIPVNGVYTNSIGGKTYIDSQNNGIIRLENWAPGDKAVIKITNTNNSNVTIKTRFAVAHSTTSNPDLFNALRLNYDVKDANSQDIGYKFMDWTAVEPTVTKISDVTVTIEFPDGDNGEILFGDANHDNQYQNCNCAIAFSQQAVQGNAATDSILDQLNAALDSAATLNGRNKTMHDALADVSSLISESLVKTAGYVWNATDDHFYYGQENTTNAFFKIYDEMPLTQTNSIYASSDWETATVNLTGVGFDAGNASGITAVNYTGAGEARTNTIRTNTANTSLTVNAPLDTIHHYDALGALNIVEAATNSYHENGKVAYAEIAKGRIVLESGSDVNEIHINKKTESTFDEVIIRNNGGQEELPNKITRDAVSVEDQTLVVKVEAGESTENVYVYANGTTGTTEKTDNQNTNVESDLGQLVLDNGGEAGEKAQNPEQKEAAKEEAVEEAVIDEIEKDDNYVARIGTTPFESLKDAVAAAVANDVIEMTANDPSTENISVNKVLTIRMNEKTFGGTIVVATTGTNAVTVVGQANVDAIVKFGNRYFNAFVTATGATVTLLKNISMTQISKQDYSGTAKSWGVDLNGHTITLSENSSEGAIYVGSYYGTNHTLTLSNGNLVFTGTSSSSVGIHAYGNIILNNVNITSSCGTAVKTEAGYWEGPGNVTITGGSITSSGMGVELISYKSGNTIRQSVGTFTNTTISANKEGIKSNGARCVIDSCSISSTTSYGVSSFDSTSGNIPSEFVVSGDSSITATAQHAINCSSGTFQLNGNVEVTGTVYTGGSSITINGGLYHGNFSLGKNGNLTINGGTFNGNLISVTQNGTLVVVGEEEFADLKVYSITGSNGTYEVLEVNN